MQMMQVAAAAASVATTPATGAVPPAPAETQPMQVLEELGADVPSSEHDARTVRAGR
jgi:hypothetical protein